MTSAIRQAMVMGRLTRIGLFADLAVLLCMVIAGPVGAQDYLDFYEQGEFALRVEKWDRAVELFSKCLANNPRFFAAYHNRAVAYSKMGQHDKSLEDLQKAVQLNPDYPDAYGLMGMIYEIKTDYFEALKSYQEAFSREKRSTIQKVLQKRMQEMEAKIKKK